MRTFVLEWKKKKVLNFITKLHKQKKETSTGKKKRKKINTSVCLRERLGRKEEYK